ncbi:hypothetical protein AB6A40_011224 [Gnathostoma spinigerum]|uniref:Protein kinase domain-containing protein n=1 Tax=Gnathostoma spinigerum TaxID=75299 RepID=A0ABD6EX41_9BILA
MFCRNLYGAVKLGEGTFGEVYLVQYKDQRVAMKVIPIGGTYAINNESQKSFETILPEVIISKELSDLRSPTLMNRTDGFIRLVGFHLVQGTYPRALRTAWKKYAKISTSLNDDPSILPKNQHYILLCYEIGGIELEKFELDSIEQAYSITYQVAFSLLIAEEELFFEHRDLHDGNILIQKDYSVAVCRCVSRSYWYMMTIITLF